jgi:excisionase family DNA binding protein
MSPLNNMFNTGDESRCIMERRFFRVREVAEMLAISRTSAYSLVRSGQLPAVEVAGTIRVPRDAAERFVERLMSGAAS